MLQESRARARAHVGASLLGVLVIWGATLAAQTIRVTPVARDGQVFVSFELADAFNADIQSAIQSGLPTSFTYDVELRRSVPLWVDRLVNSAQVNATVRYDNLTRRYQVTVTQDGRVSDTQVLDDEQLVRKSVTEFQRMPLFTTRRLEANAEYYIRVRVRTRPRNTVIAVPWDGVLGSATFTFLPR
jgi:Domain of unknown function (DUF4390)